MTLTPRKAVLALALAAGGLGAGVGLAHAQTTTTTPPTTVAPDGGSDEAPSTPEGREDCPDKEGTGARWLRQRMTRERCFGQRPSGEGSSTRRRRALRPRPEEVRMVAVRRSPQQLARGLGWFSVGLGLPQVLTPGAVARFVGVNDSPGTRKLMRVAGVRELTAGAGILTQARPAGWMWARVAGDAKDLALLGVALSKGENRRGRLAAAGAAVLGVTALDVIAGARLSRAADEPAARGRLRAKAVITVNTSPEEAYRHWRDLEHLPVFMAHLESVKEEGDGRSHWVARGPAGSTVEWDAEMVDDVPGRRIAWRSAEGADVDNSGSVRFSPAPGGRGTEVTVELEYEPPGGAVGAAVAKLFGEEPDQQLRDDLRRFKQVLETGEVVVSEGTPDGTRTQRQLKQRDAQPVG